ncbi:MAG TPA: hypothetical protein VLB44_02275 [Kofleriaceae bacterium]|nr:hypothetical protein [Kofleriaceae bacterium]
MPQPTEARLLASLPAPVRELFERARAIQVKSTKRRHEQWRIVGELLAAVDYQTEEGSDDLRLFPAASSLTATQRAVLVLLASTEPFMGIRMPEPVATARRWLGLDPPGELEKPVTSSNAKRLGNRVQTVPLWRVLSEQIRSHSVAAMRAGWAVLDRLPVSRRLVVCAELLSEPYDLPGRSLFDHGGPRFLDKLRAEGREWAPSAADALIAHRAADGRLELLVFLALVRAGLAIEPRWEALLPLAAVETVKGRAYLAECVRAIAPERQAAALAKAFARSEALSAETRIALLERYPSGELLEAIVKKIGKDRSLLPVCEKIGKKHPQLLAAARSIFRGQKPPPVLHCTRVTKPRSVQELSPLRQRQLVECGRRYDRKALSAAIRLGSGDYDTTRSFRGFVELWEIADDAGKPAFDAWRCMVDSGTVFRAGTTKVIAEIVQFGAESRDPHLELALDAVLARRPGKKKASAKKGAPRIRS